MDKFRIDSHKLIYHPQRVAQLLDGKDEWEKTRDIYPIYVEISPCGACSHRCSFCAVDYIGYKSAMLDAAILDKRLQEMGGLGIKSVMFAGEGEPLLNKRINEIVASALLAGIDVSFTTNGTLLNKLDLSGVSWIKVSVNAGTCDTYMAVHRTKQKDWIAVWDNLRDAAKRKKDCVLGVQSVLLPENAAEMISLAWRCRDAGVDYLVVKPYSQHKFSLTHEYENMQYAAYQKLEDELAAFETNDFKVIFRAASMKAVNEAIPYSKCQATPFTWAYLMANGDLYGCSAYLLDDRFNYGNLNTHTFKEVWQGEKRKANWEYVRNHLDISECRQSCRMDKVNRYLTDLMGDIPHRNFI